jgi:hypothetical protein
MAGVLAPALLLSVEKINASHRGREELVTISVYATDE